MKQKSQGLIAYLKHVIVGNPIERAKRKHKEAVERLSEAKADAAYHQMMANFHTDQVLSLDPHKHWWDFAEAKEGQKEHQEDHERCMMKVAKLNAMVLARADAFKRVWGHE